MDDKASYDQNNFLKYRTRKRKTRKFEHKDYDQPKRIKLVGKPDRREKLALKTINDWDTE